jgi:hypothetical protein
VANQLRICFRSSHVSIQPLEGVCSNLCAIGGTPAFGSDGLLIGVAGVDVVIGNLPEPLQDQVYAEFQSRNRGTQSPGVIPMACSYQVCNFQSHALFLFASAQVHQRRAPFVHNHAIFIHE